MAALRSSRRRGRDGERGAELVEFAFILPLLLLVAVGVVDFGLLFRDYEIITNAAREGARLASLADSYAIGDVKERVWVYTQDAGLDRNKVTPEVVLTPIPLGASSVNGTTVRVSYDHEFTFLGPIAGFFGGDFGSVTLKGQSTMRNETQVAPEE